MTPSHDFAEYWNERYRRGEDAWDLGTPTPVFARMIEAHRLVPGRMLVLGCGRGHDAVLFAQSGFSVTAVDFSEEVIGNARQVATAAGVTIEFLCEDLFALPPRTGSSFDYVLEYVTYCAIDPVKRADFAAMVSTVLRPGGTFIALFFPVEGRSGGPPFGVDQEEVMALFGRHFDLLVSETPVHSVRPRFGRELLTLWKKPIVPSMPART
jgi:SAM-dependent methyltransferase